MSKTTDLKMTGRDTTAQILKAQPRGIDPNSRAESTLDEPRLEAEDGTTPADEYFAGPQTDAELSSWLSKPRQKLIVWAFAKQNGARIRWLESPRPGFTVDINGGPFPISQDVVAASGEPNTVGVHFAVKTRVSPCPVGSDRLILAHQWQMSHIPDRDGYLTRRIEGEVVFHMGVMQVIGVRPDLVMNQFMHPIPLGFERRPPAVELSPRGDTVRYVIEDVDPTIIFSPGDSGATQIRILERHQLAVPYAEIAIDNGRRPTVGPRAWWQL